MAALLGSTGEGLSVMFGGDAEPILFEGDSGSDGTVINLPILAGTSTTPVQNFQNPLPVLIENLPSTSTDYVIENIATPLPMGNEINGNETFKLGNTPTLNCKRNFKSNGNVLL